MIKEEKRFFGKSDINNSSKMDNELIKKQIKYKEGDIFNVVKIEETYGQYISSLVYLIL